MQGKTINGFVLQRLLGKGGMAEVWYAENEIRKPAAVKILSAKLAIDSVIVERFRNEAEIMVRLNHPNIRQVYGYGIVDERPCIIMEYLDGDDLKARMKQGQRFSETELEKWWNQLVEALKYTHSQGIVHRDIKPGNIFVDNYGNIKLLDFGIAKVRESISSTQTGQKLGTLMYMSPEQVVDSKHVDYRTDLYSLAVTFVHLLTGKKPYDSESSSDFQISEQIVYKPLDLSGVPMAWRSFLTPYLEKDPKKRPALRHFEVMTESDCRSTDEDDGTMVEGGSSNLRSGLESINARGSENQLSPLSKEASGQKPNSKKKLWIALSVAVVAAVVAISLILKPKQESIVVKPVAYIPNVKSTLVTKMDLLAANRLEAVVTTPDSIKCDVVSYVFRYKTKSGTSKRTRSSTASFTEEIRNVISYANIGDFFVFDSIQVRGVDGSCFYLDGSLSVEIDMPKGSKEYVEILELLVELETLINNATTCEELEDALNTFFSFSGLDPDDYTDEEKLTEVEAARLEEYLDKIVQEAEKKSADLGCNI